MCYHLLHGGTCGLRPIPLYTALQYTSVTRVHVSVPWINLYQWHCWVTRPVGLTWDMRGCLEESASFSTASAIPCIRRLRYSVPHWRGLELQSQATEKAVERGYPTPSSQAGLIPDPALRHWIWDPPNSLWRPAESVLSVFIIHLVFI